MPEYDTRPVEIVPGICRIEQRLGPRHLYLYLVTGERPLLVDTGVAATPDEVVAPALARLGIAPERLGSALNTHADVDHFGGNAALKRLAPQAELIAHAADRPWIESQARILAERYGWYAAHDLDYPAETKVWLRENLGPDTPLDRTVAGGEWLDLGGRRVQVVHLPGHSPGHLGVWEPQTRTAVIGDAIMERGLYDVAGHRISPPPYFDVAAYLDSVAELERREPEHLLAAHYPALHGQAVRRFLAESRAFVSETGEAVAEALRRAGRAVTLKELTALVDARVGPFAAFATELAGPVRAHAADLVAAGQAAPVEADGLPAWRWVGAALTPGPSPTLTQGEGRRWLPTGRGSTHRLPRAARHGRRGGGRVAYRAIARAGIRQQDLGEGASGRPGWPTAAR